MSNTVSADDLLDMLAIAQLMQNWGTWRDAGDWDNLRTCYTPDATMVTTWFDGPASGFIDSSIKMRTTQPKDMGVHHVIGGTTSHVKGDRATAETRIMILLRGLIHGKLVDVTVFGRFFDFLVKSHAQWRIQRREPIYDKDSLRTVDPSETVQLDAVELARFPLAFRHLAYVQCSEGATFTTTIPEPYSAEEKAMYQRGRAWLDGASTCATSQSSSSSMDASHSESWAHA